MGKLQLDLLTNGWRANREQISVYISGKLNQTKLYSVSCSVSRVDPWNLFFAGSTRLGVFNTILYKTVRHQNEAFARKSTICSNRTANPTCEMRLRIIDKRNSKICISMTVLFIICWLSASYLLLSSGLLSISYKQPW